MKTLFVCMYVHWSSVGVYCKRHFALTLLTRNMIILLNSFVFVSCQVLTLASNERIPLNPTMRLVFEISHLKTATPATVSRAGILYINPADLGWNPYVCLFSLHSRVFVMVLSWFSCSLSPIEYYKSRLYYEDVLNDEYRGYFI